MGIARTPLRGLSHFFFLHFFAPIQGSTDSFRVGGHSPKISFTFDKSARSNDCPVTSRACAQLRLRHQR